MIDDGVPSCTREAKEGVGLVSVARGLEMQNRLSRLGVGRRVGTPAVRDVKGVSDEEAGDEIEKKHTARW